MKKTVVWRSFIIYTENRMPKTGEIYRHYKNHQCYQVIAVGKDTETLEDVVVYKALYESSDFPYGQVWCRPLKMWLENIDGRPRFEKIESSV